MNGFASSIKVKALALGVLFSVAIAVTTSFWGTQTLEPPSPSRVALLSRALIFKDGVDGSIEVFDVNASQPFETLNREKNRFMATALRLLAQERVRRSGAGVEMPFILTRWNDDRLSLSDPATGTSLELAAFGATNAATFAKLLAALPLSKERAS